MERSDFGPHGPSMQSPLRFQTTQTEIPEHEASDPITNTLSIGCCRIGKGAQWLGTLERKRSVLALKRPEY